MSYHGVWNSWITIIFWYELLVACLHKMKVNPILPENFSDICLYFMVICMCQTCHVLSWILIESSDIQGYDDREDLFGPCEDSYMAKAGS